MSISMTHDELRAYRKGYAAGRKRAIKDSSAERAQRAMDRQREAFVQRAFLHCLPALMQRGWGTMVNGKHQPFSTQDEWIDAGWRFANEAWRRQK